jgi:outer membrane receptor protein involved in Fe transport
LLYRPSASLSAQGYVFKSTLRGLIRGTTIEAPDDVEGGIVSPTGDPADLLGLLQYQSQGDVRSSGAGLSLRGRPARTLRGYLNLAYSRARLRQGGEAESALPASSSWLGSAGLSYERDAFTAALSARYVGPQDFLADRGLAGRTGDFLETNLRLSYRTRLTYPVRFDLDVRNLLDTEGALASSFVYTPPSVPVEGRRLSFAVDVRF